MFENFRDKMQTVQHDLNNLSSSFKGLTVKSNDSNQKRRQSKGTSMTINLNAGADLLNHYQKLWQEMHKRSEENVQKADQVAKAIQEIHSMTTKEYNAVAEFDFLLVSLSQTEAGVKTLERDLTESQQLLVELEYLLDARLEQKEMEERDRLDTSRKYHLARHEERQAREMEELKVRLALEHADKMKQMEKQQQAKLKERQQAFQAAFEEEVNLYKESGKIERKMEMTEENKCPSIEDVEVEEAEEDKAALDDFLADA